MATAKKDSKLLSANPKHHVRRATRVVSAVTPDVLAQPVGGFVTFLREHAIVGLAVGFVIGSQVQGLVKQATDSFINPLFELLFSGNKALSMRTFTLHFGSRHANFAWGALAYDLMDFLFVLLAIYIVIKLFSLDKLDKKKS
ncbi:MAG TPA: MscL family protein [Candidatus Saccharimonadales bacterium]